MTTARERLHGHDKHGEAKHGRGGKGNETFADHGEPPNWPPRGQACASADELKLNGSAAI
jgi:hypothetical protein